MQHQHKILSLLIWNPNPIAMKTLLLTLSIIAITTASYAQRPTGNRDANDLTVRLDSAHLYDYFSATEELVLTGSNIFIYDDAGRLIRNLYYDNIPALATFEESVTYTLNAEGHVLSALTEFTLLPQGNPTPDYLVENEYNNLGQLIQSDESIFEDSWLPVTRIEYTYDMEGRVSSATFSDYDDFDGSYELFSITNYSYEDNGSYSYETFYYFGSETPTSGFQSIVTRNSSGVLESVVDNVLDIETDSWVLEKSQIPTFDAQGNVIQMISNVIIDGNTGSQAIELIEYQYDYDNTFDEAIMPFNDATALTPDIFDILQPQNLPTQFERRFLTPQTEQLIYISDRQILFYNEAEIVSVPEVTNGLISAYPNPANDVVYISFKNAGQVQLELYDMAGQRVQTALIANNGWVSTTELPNGIYLYKATQNNNSYTGKLVVKH